MKTGKGITGIIIWFLMLSLFCGLLYGQNKDLEADQKGSRKVKRQTPPKNENKNGVSLSFEKSLNYLKQNNALLAGRNEIDQRIHERWAAFGLFFPKVTLNTRYTIMNDPLTMDLNDVRTAMIQSEASVGSTVSGGTIPSSVIAQSLDSQLPSFEAEIQKKKYYNLDVTVKQPIFTGGKIIAANRAAKARITEARGKLRRTESLLLTELVQRYYGLGLRMVVEKVRQDVYDGMEKHLYQAKKLEENGIIARSERLHAEVSKSKAERELKASKRDIEIAQVALQNTLSLEKRIIPVSKLFIVKTIEPVEYFKRQALRNNPLLALIGANRELAKQKLMKEVGENSPTIYLFGKKELYTQDLTALQPEWAVGAGATWTISEGLSGTRKVLAARKLLEKVDNLKRKARKDILTLVQKNYDELMKQLEQFNSTETSYKLAEEYLRVSEKAFEAGMATSLSVVDAKLAFSAVKIERLKAVYDFDVALAKCLEVSGLSSDFVKYRNKADMEVDFQ